MTHTIYLKIFGKEVAVEIQLKHVGDESKTTDLKLLEDDNKKIYNYPQFAYDTIYGSIIKYSETGECKKWQDCISNLAVCDGVDGFIAASPQGYSYMLQAIKERIFQPFNSWLTFRCLYGNDAIIRATFNHYSDGIFDLTYSKDFTLNSLDYSIREFCVEKAFPNELIRLKETIDKSIKTQKE